MKFTFRDDSNHAGARNLCCTLALLCAAGCQAQEADSDSTQELTNATYYVYRGQTLVEGSSAAEDAAVDRLFAEHPLLARLARTSEPNRVYLFDTVEETRALRENWQHSDPTALRSPTALDVDQAAKITSAVAPYSYEVPTFLACNEFLLATWGPCLDIFQDGAWNNGTGQFELRDLRDVTLDPRGTAVYVDSWFNDDISSLGGGYDPSDPRQGPFAVQLFADPNRGGSSWTIVIDAWLPTFYDGNIHDNRMTSRHSWGDQISSIYAWPSYYY